MELHLVASNNMDDNKQVGCYYKPTGFLQCDKDTVSNAVPKHPVSNQSNREVAQGNNNIRKNHSFPHRSLGRLLRCGRNCCLDLQHHIVTSIGKCYIPQGAKEVEDSSSCCGSCVCILHIRLDTLMNRSCPGNSWVTADGKVRKSILQHEDCHRKPTKDRNTETYVKDMVAAANETPVMELKLGKWERTKWQEAKIMMK